MAIIVKKLFGMLTTLALGITLTACSLTEGEPRVTVCQKVTQKLLDVPDIEWQGSHTETEDYSSITVRLLFTVQDNADGHEHVDTLSSTCIYAYNDIAEYDVVGQEYESSPTDIYLNDKMVDRYTLTKTVNSVMGDAIKGIFK